MGPIVWVGCRKGPVGAALESSQGVFCDPRSPTMCTCDGRTNLAAGIRVMGACVRARVVSAGWQEVVTWSSEDFGLDRRLVKACKRAGWVGPSLVQRSALPLIMEGRDVLCKAKTGAGKTAAYLLPVLNKILRRANQHRAEAQGGSGGGSRASGSGIRALILVPTNELCEQVMDDVRWLLWTPVRAEWRCSGVVVTMVHCRIRDRWRSKLRS